MKNKNLFLLILSFGLLSFARPEKEFKIFQFPQNQIPRIDGDFSDWSIVPDSYCIGSDELKNTKIGEGIPIDPKDFDLKVKVGWVKDLNRLYFYIDAYDNFWDFKDSALRQDIFEVVVDGDNSGGPFITQENWNFKNRSKNQPFFNGKACKALSPNGIGILAMVTPPMNRIRFINIVPAMPGLWF